MWRYNQIFCFLGESIVTSQFDEFLCYDNFKLAFERLLRRKGDEYKNFYYDDFRILKFGIDENLKQLISDIKENIYRPQSPIKYYLPKHNNLVRPITILTTFDLIVYQAITNVIADKLYDKMSIYFNSSTFGNVFKTTHSEAPEFFYERWKTQWRRFNNEIEQQYRNGFEYCVKFDIASFYDIIDHNILCQILTENGIETELIVFLRKCLQVWATSETSEFQHYSKVCGIPQGPGCSAFFSEIYLFPLDKIMRARKQVKYFRYADDITIMTVSKYEGNQMILYLDLVARDLALIPQTEKVTIEHIDNIGRYINVLSEHFSKIAKRYKFHGNIKTKDHNRLVKKIMECIKESRMNKTLARFALYKLNKDEKVKKLLLENETLFDMYFRGMIYYFNKYYPNDSDFLKFIDEYLNGHSTLYQYNKSIVFSEYETLPYSNKIKDNNINSSSWLLHYRMIDWLLRNKKMDLIDFKYRDTNNYLIKRKYIKLKMEVSDTDFRKEYLKSLMIEPTDSNNQNMLALFGYYLWNMYFPGEDITSDIENLNRYVKCHFTSDGPDYFVYNMRKIYGIIIKDSLVEKLQQKSKRYNEIKIDFQFFIDFKEFDADKSLQNLDLMHGLFLDTVELSFKDLSSLKDVCPVTEKVFSKIHNMRCEQTSAHFLTKQHQIRNRITCKQYAKVLSEVCLADAYKELFNYLMSF